MEHLIVIHGANHIFVGDRPRNASEYWKRYELATGASVATFSVKNEHTRSGGLNAYRSRKGGRFLYPKANAAFIFRDRFSSKTHNSVLTLANVEVLLHKVWHKMGRTTDTEMGTDLGQVLGDEYSKTSAFVNRQLNKYQILTPLQILDMLCRTLHAERVHLVFNYFSLHDISTSVLLQVYEEFKDDVRAVMKHDLDEHAGDLPLIANFTLGLISNAPDSRIRKELVNVIGHAMEVAINKDGDRDIEAMQNMLAAGYPYGPNATWSRAEWEKSGQPNPY